MNIGQALMAAQALIEPISDSARLDAELLLGHVTGFNRAQIFMRMNESIDAATKASFDKLVARRAKQEPVAYLTGEKGFWTLTLKVGPGVLVPRPETELLVEWALEVVRDQREPRIADLGTGSGAIALSIATERPDAKVIATDFSDAALAIARDNARQLGLQRVSMRNGCWLQALEGEQCNLIVSNPPYITLGDTHLQALRHEPLMALTDGGDGLNAIREIIAGAPAHLLPGGWLLLEHGYDQAPAVRELLAQAGFTQIESRIDLGGHERCSGGCIN
ncbi:peptide chain release factor N(5)-glutamine methyltransferase [Stenotrophobium rhamnosiphilum]|uniref:Release factor glutamine methyltransferase n=1 Tax=Stenotrophobium rhamnosiphilum TaxID=2029166 RepID=A0A2T5MJU8_9GAMM|nr:peptide chain release factor N(5)-glutamine methyltransferase [Stenotrophobium rhamnosiphilum]PTU32829.1 peptide chain release factor N(5)-glutamine methyltransferase [Stenotrophobium rhamnosiphilum]